jgi:hypothetical protein
VSAAVRKAARPARVALVAPHPERNNRRAALMAGTLAGAGHRVTLYVAADDPRPAGLPAAAEVVACLPAPGAEGPAEAAALDRVDVAGIDVLHVQGQAALRRLAGRLGPECKLVYDVPGLGAAGPGGNGPGPAAGPRAWLQELRLTVGEWIRAPRIDAVLCPGYVYGQFLQRELKLGRVPVVPIYAAHPLWETVRPAPPPCLRPGRPAVALAGVPFADAGPALRALAQVRAVDLVVVNGEGDWDALQAAAKEVDMADRLFRAEVDPGDLIPTLAAFQAGLVLPADTSQRALYDLPDALFTFLMAGVPVVASRMPGMERIVATHNVGRLVEPEDTEQLADDVLRLCRDPALRERLLHNVAVVRRARYCWEAQEGRLLDLYDRLLAPAGG